MNEMRWSTIRSWAAIVIGTAAALLIAWLARVAGVQLRTLLVIAAAAIALAWLVVLVTVPWNLFFAARQAVADMAISRERGIEIGPAREAEARRIAARLLRLALASHVATALASAVIAVATGHAVGYYLAGAFLLSAAIRPAVAYLAHVRSRISVLARESTHPREDIAQLRADFGTLTEEVKAQARTVAQTRADLRDDLRRTDARLADSTAHARQVLTADLARLQDAQAADRDAARSRDEAISRQVDTMVRRIEQTLDGISDHQEVQAGLRALVRMIRQDAAGALSAAGG